MRRGVLLLWSLLAASPLAFGAEDLQSRQNEARQQQQELRQRIQSLQRNIEKSESSRQDAAQALRATESAISDSDRRLLELEQRSKQVQKHLGELRAQTSEQEKLRDQRQQELAEQLRAMYASGLSPWAALLSGDDPQAIQRELGYLSYVSQAQADKIQALHATLRNLERLQANVQLSQQELAQLSAESEQKKQELLAQQTERSQVLARVQTELSQQRGQATRLQGNDERLGRLISGLDVEIARQAELARQAEQRRREAAERQRREAAEAAQRQQVAERQARELAARRAAEARVAEERRRAEQAREPLQVVRVRPSDGVVAVDAEEMPRERIRITEESVVRTPPPPPPPAVREVVRSAPPEPTPAPSEPVREVPAGGFNGLSKGLPMPVQGTVQGRFGVDRPDGGGKWRGIMIRAEQGRAVKSVGAGQVVYANWLNGYGNLLIIDHGNGLLTVYGHNQSLLKQVGDVVRAGEDVARVGATGGQVEPGLYFEIRQNGQPVNPQLWLRG
ncbi:murein hydrolase activator EnvC family protein [Paenalcaligenes suwonensis]|uniref:murein hydrolase activator EnvC family protein n=1 Tax=Paenalcaligenes suwonensis TaxID=1202713 RepID=UPI00140B8D36|nr:peptidoglycan DD-metalloendopeptidase family protein [Paenalcaligenes suwonensis]NHC60848.1 peptidoglycan DD-metalloendopeptidase family protein [Paenalcaligenes suwonensis]